MKLLYERELSPYLSQPKEDVIGYAQTLIGSNNATSNQMANELSSLMRRNKRFDEAAEIARMVFEAEQSLERLNLYFVAVTDQGDIETIRRLSDLADSYLKKTGVKYQKHLFATWLKAANKILDNHMFQYVYSQIPMEEKTLNSYIISQYYVYKNRNSQYDDVCSHYEQLPPHMQNAFYVKRYYENARARLGFSRRPDTSYRISDTSFEPVPVTMTEIQNEAVQEDGEDRQKKIFIVYGGNPVNLSVIEALLRASGIEVINLSQRVKTGSTIIEAFEKEANNTDFALVLCTPENEGVGGVWYPRMNVVFECGYFMAKLGRNNVCLLRQDNGKNLDIPSDFNSVYQISMDKGTWLFEMSAALKSAGFQVNF